MHGGVAGKPATPRRHLFLGVLFYQLLVGDFTRPLNDDWIKNVADPLLQETCLKCFAGNPPNGSAPRRFGAELVLSATVWPNKRPKRRLPKQKNGELTAGRLARAQWRCCCSGFSSVRSSWLKITGGQLQCRNSNLPGWRGVWLDGQKVAQLLTWLPKSSQTTNLHLKQLGYAPRNTKLTSPAQIDAARLHAFAPGLSTQVCLLTPNN